VSTYDDMAALDAVAQPGAARMAPSGAIPPADFQARQLLSRLYLPPQSSLVNPGGALGFALRAAMWSQGVPLGGNYDVARSLFIQAFQAVYNRNPSGAELNVGLNAAFPK